MSNRTPFSSEGQHDQNQTTPKVHHPLLQALEHLRHLGWSLSEIAVKQHQDSTGQIIKLTTKHDLAVFRCKEGECTLLSRNLEWTKCYLQTKEWEEVASLRWHALRRAVEEYLQKRDMQDSMYLTVQWIPADGVIELDSVYYVHIYPDPTDCGATDRAYDLEPSFQVIVDKQWTNR